MEVPGLSSTERPQLKVYVLVDDYARRRGFIGQHGFSALVELRGHDGTVRVLVDAGQEGRVVLANAERLGLDLSQVDAILITHGHYDHAGGLLELLEEVELRGKPLVIHPDAFKPKLAFRAGKLTFVGTSGLREEVLRAKGVVPLVSRGPIRLADGVFSTGEIKRQTDFERVEGFFTVGPGGLVEDAMLDDQALVVRLPGGLVVVTGCAHSGVVNTVLHAQELTGEKRVLAVIGGFHLEGASQEVLDETVKALKGLGPERVLACHCTGLRAFCKLQSTFGPRFERLSSGSVVSIKVGA